MILTPPIPPTMPHAHRHYLALPMLLCAAALGACGGEGESVLDTTHAQPPIPAAPSTPPSPLHEVEVTLYLQVMREAAQRVEHPSNAERRILAQADAITTAANRGEILATGRGSGEVLARALALRMQMDLEVARERHLDAAHYQALSERIEGESGELYCNPAAAVPDRSLEPHVAEIEHLVGIVRNPGSTGAAPLPPVCADGQTGPS